ncbi:hypothetical protein BSKO_13408 [Bryopsis sp. KO-2023]|nr:hypothetical protein BSKO_13408 [Bryopsis sp. KO-2023]
MVKNGDMNDEYEEKLINEEYKIWKKNTPFLYDLVVTHALEWPSLTVQWLPGVEEVPDKESTRQRMVLGTHTSGGEPNSLLVTEVLMPNSDSEMDLRQTNDELMDFGALGRVAERVKNVKVIPHEGEVNRARYMPQNPNMIATKTIKAQVFLFCIDHHPDQPAPDQVRNCNPDIRLTGHEQEGYGLAWSPFKPGYLLSGSDDQRICLWDVNAQTGPGRELNAMNVYHEHKSVVEDVAWHNRNEWMFGSVGDDRCLILWDLRVPPHKAVFYRSEAHEAEANSLCFNPNSEYILATGSADKTIALHDIRNLNQRLHSLEGHAEEVFQINWSTKNETILASCGADRRVIIWDLSRIGDEQITEDNADGPPELLFIHGGHTAKVSDFSWNPNEDWVLSSVAEDNILQVWQMADYVYDENYYKR